jgi:hypothetical protein
VFQTPLRFLSLPLPPIRKMTKDKNKVDKEQIWTIVFAVIPVVIFMNMGEYFTNDSGMNILYGGLFGGIGGLIGFAINQIVKTKSTLIKGVTLGVFLIVSFLTIRLIQLNYSNSESILIDESDLITCQVCGYKTLTKDDKFCGECFVELTASEMTEEGYRSIEGFIKEEQTSFFTPDSIVEDIDFFNPKVSEDGYKKDLTWKPIASKDTILKFNKEYVEYIKNNPIEITIKRESLKK